MDYDELRQKEIEQILERLRAEKEKPCLERLKTLEQLKVTAASNIGFILVEVFKAERDPGMLSHVISMMGRVKAEEAVMPLIDFILGNREVNGQDEPLKANKDEFVRLRCAAIKTLGILKDERAVIPLMFLLNEKDEHYKIRLNVAEALGRIGDTYALNPLINLVTDEKESSIYVRESAARALGMLGDVRAVKPLIKILDSKRGIFDKFTFLKEQIIEAISRIGPSTDKDTVRSLKESLMDEAPSVRLSSVEALANLGDPSLIRLLVPMVYDEEEDVAREAVRGIYQLEGILELRKLLEDDRLPGWSRDEIEMALEEE